MFSTPQRKITSVLFSTSLIITLIPLQSTAINAAGPAITTTTATAIPTILNGKTPPTSSVGKNGDFYIDTKNLMFYGPKKNGSWPLGLSMKGDAGKDGVDGKFGNKTAEAVLQFITNNTEPAPQTTSQQPTTPTPSSDATQATSQQPK